jgi:hypothetical protein
LFFLISLAVFSLGGCQKNPYEFIGNQNGQSVYLDAVHGKVIFVDESNRIIDYLDLKPNSEQVNEIVHDKAAAISNKEWKSQTIPGKDYSVSLSTRFYNNRLLYVLKVSPGTDKARDFARTVSVELTDRNGFVLGEIETSYSWTRTLDDDGTPVFFTSQGSIPITLRNYLEISSWGPRWRD